MLNQATDIEHIQVIAIDDDPQVLATYQTIFHHFQSSALDGMEGLEGMFEEKQKFRLPLDIEMDTAASGREGVDMFSEKENVVGLLDMRMPGGWDGLKTAKEIYRQDPRVRIVFITAHMDYQLSDLHQQIGANFALLKKPFDQDELVQNVIVLANDWLREKRLFEAEQQAQRLSRAKDELISSMNYQNSLDKES